MRVLCAPHRATSVPPASGDRAGDPFPAEEQGQSKEIGLIYWQEEGATVQRVSQQTGRHVVPSPKAFPSF